MIDFGGKNVGVKFRHFSSSGEFNFGRDKEVWNLSKGLLTSSPFFICLYDLVDSS